MYCSSSSAYICPTWLLLTFIPVLCHLVPSLMEHNVMVSGRQIDPEQTCMTGSPLQYACGFLSHRTLQFVGSSASLLTPQLLSAEHELEGVWEQPVLFFFFFFNNNSPNCEERKQRCDTNEWRNTELHNSHISLIVLS